MLSGLDRVEERVRLIHRLALRATGAGAYLHLKAPAPCVDARSGERVDVLNRHAAEIAPPKIHSTRLRQLSL